MLSDCCDCVSVCESCLLFIEFKSVCASFAAAEGVIIAPDYVYVGVYFYNCVYMYAYMNI